MPTKPVKAKRAPKTVKEKLFVKHYIDNGGNATQAALKVYDTDNYYAAATIGKENVKKLQLEDFFIAAGLTKETMAQNTARIALTATKQNQYTGEIESDNKSQLDGMKFAAELCGYTKSDTNIQVIVSPILASSVAIPTNHLDQEDTGAQKEN